MIPLNVDEPRFCLYDDAKLLATCFYSPESGEICEIRLADSTALPYRADLIKAVLSSLEYAGVAEAWSKNVELFPLLKALRFDLSNGEMRVALKGYFDVPCAGCAGKMQR